VRDRRGSLFGTVLDKLRREGLLAVLVEGPTWLYHTGLAETRLALARARRRRRYRREGMVAVPDPTATIEVDPASVRQLVPLSRFPESSPRELLGIVRGGDWDRNLPRIEDRPKYEACRARVEDGVPWAETGIIDHLAAELDAADADTIEHGCGSRAALLERYETEREALYRSLRTEGYDRERSPVCCRIHVGRDGRLLFAGGGRHRFYLSRLLGIESVPVQVCCRHREWQAVRDAVATADGAGDLPAGIRNRLGHPDLRRLAPEGEQADAPRAAAP
jgi:hypothetical protein